MDEGGDSDYSDWEESDEEFLDLALAQTHRGLKGKKRGHHHGRGVQGLPVGILFLGVFTAGVIISAIIIILLFQANSYG